MEAESDAEEWPKRCSFDSYYSELTEITDTLGLTVAPRAGAPPNAATSPASNIQPAQATGNGSVDPNGLPTIYYFQYGTTTAYGSSTVAFDAGSSFQPGSFSGPISGLTPGTTYHYRIVAGNSAGSSVGGDQVFTTPAPPTVATEPPTEVKGQNATLNASVNPNGQATSYRFEYGLTTAYGTNVPVPDGSAGSGLTAVAVSNKLANLEDGTYHYRISATNGAGTSYGGDRTFVIDNRPLISNEPASEVTIGTATLNGRINPQAFASTYRFEYVSDEDFSEDGFVNATRTPVPDAAVGSGSSDVAVSRSIAGLEAETLYHSRIVATNLKGTRIGPEFTFHTKTVPPTFSLAFAPAESGTGEVRGPEGMAVDAAGNLYVANSLGNPTQVAKYSPSGAFLATIAKFGYVDGLFQAASGIAIDSAGNLWVCDRGRNLVQKLTPSGTFISKFGGTGVLNSPRSIAIDSSGNILVGDLGKRIQKFSPAGTLLATIKGGSGNGPELTQPSGLALDPQGDIWVVDPILDRAVQYSPAGTFMSEFGTFGTAPGQLSNPQGIAIKPSGDVLISDVDDWTTKQSRVQQFTPSGEFITAFGPGQISHAQGIALGLGGAIFVSDNSGGQSRLTKWQE